MWTQDIDTCGICAGWGLLDNLTFIREPSTGLLLASGLLALAARRRSRA